MYWGIIIRTIIESHIIGFICCIINVKRADHSVTDAWTEVNTYLSYIVLPIYVLFPVAAIFYMYRQHESLGQQDLKSKYGELYEGYSLKNKSMLIFWGLEYVRKMLLAIVVVVW